MAGKSESPIEDVLVEALRECIPVFLPTATLEQQEQVDLFAIGKYRLDITLAVDSRKVDVECDGAEWHERTQDQAENDRERDRLLQLAGYLVARFTGRQILRDPVLCAARALELLGADVRDEPTLRVVRRRMSARSESWRKPGDGEWYGKAVLRGLLALRREG